jgi:arylsulfatase A-like enzyme
MGSRWTVAALAALGWIAAAGAQEESEAAPTEGGRKNVLFIAVDDLRPELGCYGSTVARTPHMDAFARTALRFDQHYVQAPSCGPSRYALLTGRSPDSSGAFANDALFRGPTRLRASADPAKDPAKGAQSLPEAFRRGGYRTVCIGKISHTPDGRVFAYDGQGDGRHELPNAWDELATPLGPWGRGWGSFFAYAGGAHREDGEGHQALAEFAALADTDLPDGLMAKAASEKLVELKERGEPFFLGLGFFKPHLPFVAPRADLEAMAKVEIKAPIANAEFRPPSYHRSGEFRRYDSPWFEGPDEKLPLTDEEAIEARRAYLACVRYVDRQIGIVLQALESEGLSDSTIVVIWGDHGWHLGESGVWGKHTMLDRSLRSVLMMRAPGVTAPGTETASLVSSIDLAPTLLQLCGLKGAPMAAPLDGLDLSAVLTDPAKAVRSETEAYFGSAKAMWGTIRTERYRLIARRKEGVWKNARVFDCAASADPGPDNEVTLEEVAAELMAKLPK